MPIPIRGAWGAGGGIALDHREVEDQAEGGSPDDDDAEPHPTLLALSQNTTSTPNNHMIYPNRYSRAIAPTAAMISRASPAVTLTIPKP